ncbi:MAG: IS3 family transposase [Pseudomonadota bacterium]|nr:IS3 family transposase [Pseudomonadota bacterium]
MSYPLVHHQRFETRAQAESAIREHIKIFYNHQRRYSRISYLAPTVFAQSFTRLAA